MSLCIPITIKVPDIPLYYRDQPMQNFSPCYSLCYYILIVKKLHDKLIKNENGFIRFIKNTERIFNFCSRFMQTFNIPDIVPLLKRNYSEFTSLFYHFADYFNIIESTIGWIFFIQFLQSFPERFIFLYSYQPDMQKIRIYHSFVIHVLYFTINSIK